MQLSKQQEKTLAPLLFRLQLLVPSSGLKIPIIDKASFHLLNSRFCLNTWAACWSVGYRARSMSGSLDRSYRLVKSILCVLLTC